MKLVFISPCFNAEQNLENLIKSVKSQSDDRWEHIFIDDISTDNTWKKLEELVGDDDRFRLIRNKEKKFALKNIIEVAREYQNQDNVGLWRSMSRRRQQRQNQQTDQYYHSDHIIH